MGYCRTVPSSGARGCAGICADDFCRDLYDDQCRRLFLSPTTVASRPALFEDVELSCSAARFGDRSMRSGIH